jgi:hypothetical protein
MTLASPVRRPKRQSQSMLTRTPPRFTIQEARVHMSTKIIAIVVGGIVAVAAWAFLWRDSSETDLRISAPSSRAKSAGSDDPMADPRFASRPKVSNVHPDLRRRDEKGETTSEGREEDGSGGTSRKRFEAESAGAGSAQRGGEVRSQLEESSLPFERSGAVDGGAGAARRPWGDTRHGEPPDLVDTLDEPLDPADENQPVLSLFDGDDAGVTEASIDKGVSVEEDGARFSEGSEFAVPMAGRITGEAGSISFWVRPEGDNADVSHASLLQLRSHYEYADRIQIWKDGGNVRLVFADSNGQESGAVYASDAWADGEPRLVTVTWGDGENALYVNGELAGTSEFDGFKIRNDTLLHIASNYSEEPKSLEGTVSQFRVFDRQLAPDEVSALPSDYPE